MLKSQTATALSLAVSIGVMTMIFTVGSSYTLARSEDKSDAQTALPRKEELPEFDNFKAKSGKNRGIAGSDVTAYRKSDKAQLQIVSIIADSEADAKAWVHMSAVVVQSAGAFHKGSETGRAIGQECWNSNRDEGPPKGFFAIIARDGRAVTSVRLTPLIKADKDSVAALKKPISAADVRKVEDEAIKVLAKLTNMGYTSKSKK